MTYDGATDQTVLFGGANSNTYQPLDGTWTYDPRGGTWIEQSPAVSPPPRYGAAMAYDAATSQIIVFGGQGSSGALADTWAYDAVTDTWTPEGTGPPARDFATMSYDAATDQIVLFGGYGVR